MKRTLISVLFSASLVLTGCSSELGPSSMMPERDPVQVDPTYPPAFVELGFDSYGHTLNGILYQANGIGAHPTVVLLHGYPGNEKNLDLAQSMRRNGYNVLFFHYRGAWGSAGDFSFTNAAEDVGSALVYLRDNAKKLRVDVDRIIIIGHSVGGYAALQGAAQDDAINCVIAIAPADVGIVADFINASPEAAKSFASRADALGMLDGWSGEKALKEFNDHRDALSLIDAASKLNGKSVFLIAGDKDTAIAPDIFHVPLVSAYQKQPNIDLTHIVIPGDHSFSWSRIRLTTEILEWTKKCI